MSWTGAKSHIGPVAFTALAVDTPIASLTAESQLAPTPSCCGNFVAPSTLLCPCTASTPYTIGMCSRELSIAYFCTVLTRSAQALGVLLGGVSPPPDRTEPTC
jgi:hypothetical protein